MQFYWRSLITDVGLEKAVLLVSYTALVIACVLALVVQIAWQVAKRVRPRRELQDVVEQRRRELDSAFKLTERT